MEALNDIVLLFWAFYFYLFFVCLFRVHCPSCFRLCAGKKPEPTPRAHKQVFILRGVPGSGKDNYVYHRESFFEDSVEKNNTFAIVSNDEYFHKYNNSTFSGRDVMKAMSFCMNQYLNYLQFGVSRIYVSNVNNKGWMYTNFVKLAGMYNYEVVIVELKCYNMDYLKYFRDRTKFNTPITFCKNVFQDWDEDENSAWIEPYLGNHIGPLPGDSLPYPKCTLEHLDRELDEYMREKCSIQSESEEEVLASSEPEFDTDSDSSSDSCSESSSYTSNSCSNDSEDSSSNESTDSECKYPTSIVDQVSLNAVKQIRRRQVHISNKTSENDDMLYSIRFNKKVSYLKDDFLLQNYFE